MTVGPLDGVRIVEISSWMAAPSAGAVLADMGADVVKVEPLGGDVVRGMSRKAKGAPDIDHSFHMDNRGKRSIAVALDRPDGAEIVRRLDRPRRRVPVQPAAPPPGALRPRPGHHPRPQPPPRARHAVRLRPRRARRRPGPASTSRRSSAAAAITDAMTEPGGIAPIPAPGAGRPHDRHRHGRRRCSPRCASPSGPARGRSSTSACSPPRHGRWPAIWPRRWSTAARSPSATATTSSRRSPTGSAARRPLDHPQHARGALVGTVLQDGRAGRAARGRALPHGQGPLRQHAGADRHPRRGDGDARRSSRGAGSSTTPG